MCGSILFEAHHSRPGKPLDISEVRTILELLANCDPSLKLGLNVFLEGIQGLSGHHRLLINAEDALKHLPHLENTLMSLDKHWEFCIRSDRSFILVFSSGDPYRAAESRPTRHSPPSHRPT